MNKQLFCVMDDSKKDIEMTPEISQMHNDCINRIKEKYAYLLNDNDKLNNNFYSDDMRYVMDETSVPYEHNENPFPRTTSDDEFDEMIINKYHLTTKEMEKDV